jgi:predicted glycosyltransferase
MYSHDTYGLGHLTRTLRIARGVRLAFPGAGVLVLSGSPVAHRVRFPQGVEYVKLPSVVKSGPETYLARELRISFGRIRRMRAQIIRDTLRHYEPDILLVDNVPHGMKGELVPTLQWLHEHRPEVQIHLDLRDVLDDPDTLRESWNRAGVPELLRTVYHAIHVFGSRSVHDAVRAYDLPEDRSDFLGYIAPWPEEETPDTELPPCPPELHRVLVTVGGGGDGEKILWTILDLQASLKRSPYDVVIVTGPLADPEVMKEVARRVEATPQTRWLEFVRGLPGLMRQADVVLCMGGYNTLCEVLSEARRCVVVPRIYPRREQWVRATALEQRGLLRVVHPEALSPETLHDALQAVLQRGPEISPVRCPPLNGIHRFAEKLRALYGVRDRGAPPRRPGSRSMRPLVERSHAG